MLENHRIFLLFVTNIGIKYDFCFYTVTSVLGLFCLFPCLCFVFVFMFVCFVCLLFVCCCFWFGLVYLYDCLFFLLLLGGGSFFVCSQLNGQSHLGTELLCRICYRLLVLLTNKLLISRWVTFKCDL